MHLVHRDEPLRRGAEDHRILAAPAVRITMLVFLAEQQHAAFAHEVDDLIVSGKHIQAREVSNVGCKPSGIVDGAVDVQTVTLADDEVVVTMTGGGMDRAGSGLAVG